MDERGIVRLSPFMAAFMQQSSPRNDVGVQTSIECVDKATQVGEAFVKGAFYRMLHMTKSFIEEIESKREDPLISAFGKFGRWQIMVQTVLFLYNMPYVFQLVVAEYENTLFGKYWCARPNHLSNMPVEKWKEISGIFKTEGSKQIYDPCLKKNLDYDNVLLNDTNSWISNGGIVKCTEWEFEDNFSIVSEWRLACMRPSATTASESILAVGGMLGGLFNGYIMDRRGRRTYLTYCLGVNTLISFLTALSPSYWMYLLFRGVQGFFIIGIYPSLSILSMEITGQEWIGLISSTNMYSFPIGYMICALVAHTSHSWRNLHYAITFLSISLLTAWWMIPESPRWLWTHRKYKRLLKLIQHALLTNGHTSVDHEVINTLKTTGPMTLSSHGHKVRFSDLYRTETIRKITYVAFPLCFFAFIAYYGIILRLETISHHSDIYRSYLFAGVIDFTATSVSLSLVAKTFLSDTLILFVSSTTAGILFLFVNALPDEATIGVLYCVLGARFFIGVMNTSLLSYIALLYPTKMRGLAVCTCNAFSFLALLVIAHGLSLEELKTGLSVFLMGISGIVTGFLVLLLPQPMTNIPDTVNQVENPFPTDFDVVTPSIYKSARVLRV